MRNPTHNEGKLPGLSPQDLAQLGDGAVAYVKTIMSDDVARLFPQAPPIQPGVRLFALLSASGAPILPGYVGYPNTAAASLAHRDSITALASIVGQGGVRLLLSASRDGVVKAWR